MNRALPLCIIVVQVGICASALPAQSVFTEEAFARGLVHSAPITLPPAHFGYGLALADLDNDSDLDVALLGHAAGLVALFENDGAGNFTDRTGGVTAPTSFYYSGIAAADFDADGDIDLYVTNWVGANLLLENLGGFQFNDIAATAGVAELGPGTGCAWGDYNGDGWLDLYVVNRTGQFGIPSATYNPNELYRNLGNGTFVAEGALQGVNNSHWGFQGIFFDYDRDADVDLYLSNDKGAEPQGFNRLWRNDQGTLTDVSIASGTNVAIDSMGAAIGDVDGNGFFDIYLTNTVEGNPLLMNQGDGRFVDMAVATGVIAYTPGWGTHFFDHDNDAFLELYVGNWAARDYIYDFDGQLTATEVGIPLGFTNYIATLCTAIGDVDGDGDIDLLLQGYGDPIRLYMNPHNGAHNWIQLQLQGDWPNTQAVGATIDLLAGGRVQASTVLAGCSFKSTSMATQHFGLGLATTVDSITVTWPGGAVTNLVDVSPNQKLVIEQTPLIVDCNGNGVNDTLDVSSGSSSDANSNGVPDECDARIVRGDADGSGAVNIADAIALLRHLFSDLALFCGTASDVNDDGTHTLGDATQLLTYLFTQGPPPLQPAAACGLDMTPDNHVCNVTRSGCP
ncbi:MAG: FG-GAP-like repeat-containing protein [Planctomycetota bacterium]